MYLHLSVGFGLLELVFAELVLNSALLVLLLAVQLQSVLKAGKLGFVVKLCKGVVERDVKREVI